MLSMELGGELPGD